MNKRLYFIAALTMLHTTAGFPQSDFSSSKVAVFKNGTAFFIKSGSVISTDGRYVLSHTPEALFGTLWAGAKGERVKALHSLKTKTTESKTSESIRDMLAGNIGKKAKVILYSEATYEAEIVSVSGNVVTLNTKEKWVTTEISAIKTMEFIEKPNLTYDMETDNNQLAMDFFSDGKKEVSLMYLERGMGWFPSYLIELDDKGNAMITLRSTLMNDAEDLEKAEVNLVVGVPNFKYNSLYSPLCSNQTLAEFIASLNAASYNYGRYNVNTLSNIMTQSASAYYPGEYSGGADMAEEALPDGKSLEDLFFYTCKEVSLKKGERTTFDLVHHTVPYEHIYEVDLKQNNISGYGSDNSSGEETNQVWHSVKLKNTTDKPWTTGTATIMKVTGSDFEPLSQDMLKYTPGKGNAYVKITVSPDINVKDSEEETGRVEKSKRHNGYYYDLVTIEGTIIIKNYKNEEVNLKAKRKIIGQLVKSGVEWESTKMPTNYYRTLDPTNDVNWEVNLKAGEEKTITYTYTVYVSQ